MQSQIARYLTGAIAGLAATVPMTAFMVIAKRRLSWPSQESLPPVQISQRMLQAVHLRDKVSSDQEATFTAVNHFAYGAGAGAVYGRWVSSRSLTGSIASGIIYGLGVWSGSYFGFLPAAGLYRSPGEDTPERTRLMIGAHIVWGGSLGLITYLFSQPSPSPVMEES